MATNKGVKTAVRKAASTVGRQDKLTAAMIKAGKKIGSYKEYLTMDPGEVSKLNTKELRSVVARLNKIESKRLKNLEKYGYNSAAVRGIEDTGGKTKASTSMSRQELLHEYKRAKSFLESGTSTVKGAREFMEGIAERVGASDTMTPEQVGRLYDLLDKYKESGAIGFYKKGDKKSAGYETSQATQKDIYSMMQEGMTDDQILENLGVMSRTEYEAMQDTSTDFQWVGSDNPWES